MKTFSFTKLLFILSALFFCSFILSSCGKQVISKDKFVDVYCDLSIAQDTLEFRDFTAKKKEILKKYGMTENDLKTTYQYYYSNPKLWEPFFKSVTEKIDALRNPKSRK